jgi:acetate kinase
MSILVVNAGSTSLKFGLFAPGKADPLVSGAIDWADGDRQHAKLSLGGEVCAQVAVPDDRAAALCAIETVLKTAGPGSITAIGHRVVHGGTQFDGSVIIEERVKQAISNLSSLAPLHNPPALAAIEAGESLGVPQVAVFDTSFFARLPARATHYAIPYEWVEKWGVRKIGFHGISNAYCTGRANELLGGDPTKLRLIICHLGGGCSASAVVGGSPVATTMGFSTIEGLPMGTRSGSVDPGLLLHLQREHGFSAEEIERGLTRNAGLLGVSGISSDLAQVEAAAQNGNERAQLAFELFADRVRAAIGGLAVTMGGVDALIFTDRIGESSPVLRAAACKGLGCLGLNLDPERNADCQADTDIATVQSSGRILVLHTREEWMIARETERVLS